MKRTSLVTLTSLAIALAACGGGGGGDQAAFCDEFEALAELVEDGDLATERGLREAAEVVTNMLEAADEGDQADAVVEVGETIERADPDEPEETFEVIEDELGDFADDCDIDLEAPEPPETTTTTAPETTTTTAPDTTTTTIDDDPPGDDPQVNARQPVPAATAAAFLGLAQGCFDGDMAACDDLFFGTPIDSVEEAYGETCGGRLVEPRAGQCTDLVTAPIPVPAEVADQANAAGCFAGDMAACDTLFNTSAEGSIDEAYGGLCGGRVPNTIAFCVDIFGPVAFQ